MTIDSISNLLTILRNAVTIKKSLVSLPYTKNNYQIVKILEKEGFIHCATFTSHDGPINRQDPHSKKNALRHKTGNWTTPVTGAPHDYDFEQQSHGSRPKTSSGFTNEKTRGSSSGHASGINNNISKLIVIALKYIGREKKPIIHSLKLTSKPSLRWYAPNPIPQSLGGLGILIVSTSLGIMTDKEARTKKLGGEILLEIW